MLTLEHETLQLCDLSLHGQALVRQAERVLLLSLGQCLESGQVSERPGGLSVEIARLRARLASLALELCRRTGSGLQLQTVSQSREGMDKPDSKEEDERRSKNISRLTSAISWFNSRYALRNSPAKPVSLTSTGAALAFVLTVEVDVRVGKAGFAGGSTLGVDDPEVGADRPAEPLGVAGVGPAEPNEGGGGTLFCW